MHRDKMSETEIENERQSDREKLTIKSMKLPMSIPIDYVKCETNALHAFLKHVKVFTKVVVVVVVMVGGA